MEQKSRAGDRKIQVGDWAEVQSFSKQKLAAVHTALLRKHGLSTYQWHLKGMFALGALGTESPRFCKNNSWSNPPSQHWWFIVHTSHM